MKKIIIVGGTGFLGKVLTDYLGEQGHQIVILCRSNREDSTMARYVKWDGIHLDYWKDELEGADVLVNLAGRTVNCRYTANNKADIYDSRINSTRILGEAVGQCKNPPKLWINSSTATIYRHELEKPNTERDGIIGTGFSVDVAKKWEKAFNSSNTPKTRKVALRTAIVLGYEGEAFNIYKTHAYLGISGRHGNGNQMVSWLHELDFARIIDYVIANEDIIGPVNAAAPNAITNRKFLKTVRKIAKIPFGIPLTSWMIRLGALIIGTDAEMVLKSRWVYPDKLVTHGYKFVYDDVEDAIRDLFRGKTTPDQEAKILLYI